MIPGTILLSFLPRDLMMEDWNVSILNLKIFFFFLEGRSA